MRTTADRNRGPTPKLLTNTLLKAVLWIGILASKALTEDAQEDPNEDNNEHLSDPLPHFSQSADAEYTIGGYSSYLDKPTFLAEWDNPNTPFDDVQKAREFFKGKTSISKKEYSELLLYFLDGTHAGEDTESPDVLEFVNKRLRPVVMRYLKEHESHHKRDEYTKDDVVEDLVEGRISREITKEFIDGVFEEVEGEVRDRVDL